MSKSNWPPERTAILLSLVEEGITRSEIAERMNTTNWAIAAKLRLMDIHIPLKPTPEEPAQAVMRACPKFENVTREEATKAHHGAPNSARYTREINASLVGNSASLCVSN